LEWMLRIAVITHLAEDKGRIAQQRIAGSYQVIQQILEAEAKSDYQVEKLLEAAEPEPV
jgi:hypothetical protein